MKKMKKRKLLLVILLPVILAAAGASYLIAKAVWDESTAVHVNPSEIENSTLAVGTHLIHLSALTDEIYGVAEESATESGQDRIYYKSELAEGAWFDITEASTLDDITSGGVPVEDRVIAELLFTHHTKSDGKTYDLRTGKQVAIQDIIDPYDLESMEELVPLKTRYDLIKEEQGDSKEGKAKIARIREFFATSTKNSTTDRCDAEISALQVYYNVLCDNDGTDAEMSAVQAVMDAVDAARRVKVFAIVEQALSDYATELQRIEDSEDEEGNVVAGSGADTNLQSAVNESLQNVTESLTEQRGKMLSEGSNVMSRTKYKLSLKLIEDTRKPDHAACDEDVKLLIALDNIMNSVVADKETELRFLEDTLLPEATDQYIGGLRLGENAEYASAVAANSSYVVLKRIANGNKSDLNTYRNELEFYISAKCLRLDNSPAKDFINERLTQTYDYPSEIPSDFFSDGSNETIQDHIDFLQKKLRELELAGGGNELDKLAAELSDLQTEYMSALDENDLAGAAEIGKEIEELERKMALFGEALGDGTDGSLGSAISGLKNDCLDLISGDGGSGNDISDLVDSLIGMLDLNLNTTFPALQEVLDAMKKERDLNGNGSFDDEIAAIEQAMLDNLYAYEASKLSDLDQTAFEEAANGYFTGGSPLFGEGGALGDGLDPSALDKGKQDVVTILALKQYNETTGSQNAADLMRIKTQNLINLGNPLAFSRVNDVRSEFLPVTAIASYTRMRYVWRTSANEATLARGGRYYVFTVFSDRVQRSRNLDESDIMDQAAQFLTVVHIPESYAYDQFGVEAIYIDGTKYGVLCSDELRAFAEELFEVFMQAAS